MPVDLTRLSPAPWEITVACYKDGGHDLMDKAIRSQGKRICDLAGNGPPGSEHGDQDLANAEFFCLARSAFEVMLRREWGIGRDDGEGWYPIDANQLCHVYCRRITKIDRDDDLPVWPDPFTALVEADRWYAANVEGKTTHAG